MTALPGQWPSDAAIDRIVDAVGEKYAGTLNRDGLRIALHELRLELLSRSSDQLKLRQRKSLEIAKHANELADMLSNTTGDRLLDIHLWFDLNRAETVVMLRRLAESAERGGGLGSKTGPLKTWLTERLADAWRHQFHREPGRSRSSPGGEAGGPFVRFVMAAAAEMGQEISAETIASVITNMGKSESALN